VVASQVSVERVESSPVPQDAGGKLRTVLYDRHRPPAQTADGENHMPLALHSAMGFLQLPASAMWDHRTGETLSAGFCVPVQERGKNSLGSKKSHNSHYGQFSSTLMLLPLT